MLNVEQGEIIPFDMVATLLLTQPVIPSAVFVARAHSCLIQLVVHQVLLCGAATYSQSTVCGIAWGYPVEAV